MMGRTGTGAIGDRAGFGLGPVRGVRGGDAQGGRRLFSRRPAMGSGVGSRRGRGTWLAVAVASFAGAALAGWLGLSPSQRPEPKPDAPLPREVVARAADVRVVDGDTLKLGDATVRLAGLDAPERGQVCQRADGTRFDCGEAAARHLATLVHRRGVACGVTGRDRYGRAVGLCHADGLDLAEAMVASGWALALAEGRRGPSRYGVAEAQARSARNGLWEGRFDTPESWRRAH